MTQHPMQPVIRADDGVIRFKSNAIVWFLLDWSRQRGMGLNELGDIFGGHESVDDWNQLAQLLGYSVSAFGDLSYADPQIVAQADAIAATLRASG